MSSPRTFSPMLSPEQMGRLAEALESLLTTPVCRWLRSEAEAKEASPEARATFHVLADLTAAGWTITCADSAVRMLPPSLDGMSVADAKGAVRRALAVGRKAQLAEHSTRRFIDSMHAERTFQDGRVSILDLADDGPSLATALLDCGGRLDTVVRPYLQAVVAKARCEHTGYLLTDIWRYFRHTWSLTYRPTPGRTVCFLIRNAARPKHPVMAIAGLANAVFQLAHRDAWIGWTVEEIAKAVTTDPSRWAGFRAAAESVLRATEQAVRSDDLLAEIDDDGEPPETSRKLADLAHREAEARKRDLEDAFREFGAAPVVRDAKRLPGGDRDWKSLSETPLYRRKRAEVLSEVIPALHFFASEAATESSLSWAEKDGKGKVRWRSKDGERAVRTAIREIRKAGLSARVMDVNVCGATPVYRPLLAGKLAALSLFSAEACGEYSARYGSAVSEIASGMAGRPVTKPADLCLLTTTSLYGVGSSQYNRLRLPNGEAALRWEKIGESEGFGTVHMSRQTIDAVRAVAVACRGMRNVNNQFGEGSNPLMRQLREGLEALGFSSDDVLNHSNKRLIYAAELYPGAAADLALGRAEKPDLPTMDRVATHWTNRWLRMRIRDDVLEKVANVSRLSVKGELCPEEEAEEGGDVTPAVAGATG